MSVQTVSGVKATEPNEHGYRSFSLGEFTFRRDEYFVYVKWPTGRHVLSADGFLRALQRDVAWEFFYGTVDFDGVVGTVNHYGTVDLFAGRYNDAYRKAELDHVENFPTPVIKATFNAMLDDWTNSTFDPFASPHETGTAFGPKAGNNRAAVTRRRVAAKQMVAVPGDEALRSDATGHPINRHFVDVPQDEPRVVVEPGFEGQVSAFNLFAYLSRSNVTWNPSVVSVCKSSLYCPTTEEYILPIIHGNDRVEWFVQLSDEIYWDVEDRDTGAVRAKVVMKPGTSRPCRRISVTRATPPSAPCCWCGRTRLPISPRSSRRERRRRPRWISDGSRRDGRGGGETNTALLVPGGDHAAPRGRELSGRRGRGYDRVPRRPAGEAHPVRGAGRRREDGARKGNRGDHRAPADAASVLRRARRGEGALRVELQEATPPHPGGFGSAGLAQGRTGYLHGGLPARAPTACRHSIARARGAADRRGRSGRGGDGGVAPGAAVGVAGVDSGAGHDHRDPASAGGLDVEQHA